LSISEISEVITTIAVLAGLLFGALEIRQFRKGRERESALQLFETFQNMDFSIGTKLLFDLPDKEYSEKELREYLGDDIKYINLLGTSFEGLGILVKNREVSIDLVEEYFGGPISLYWKRRKKEALEIREKTGRETYSEFVQWLAERLEDQEKSQGVVPAQIEFKDWKKKKQ